MKKLLLVVFVLALSLPSFSQDVVGRWKVKRIGVTLGQDQDMINDLSHTYLMNTVRGFPNAQYENIPFAKSDLYSMTCENPNLRVELALLPPRMRNTELRVALSGMFNRIDAVNYQAYNPDGGSSTLNFRSHTNEIAAEAVLLKRASLWNTFNFYGGVGTNLGTSFAGNVRVSGSNLVMNEEGDFGASDDAYTNNGYQNYTSFYDYYEVKNGLHQRAFLQGGFSIVFLRRLEIGLEARYGIGYRLIGGQAVGTNLVAAGFTAKWILK